MVTRTGTMCIILDFHFIFYLQAKGYEKAIIVIECGIHIASHSVCKLNHHKIYSH